MKQRNIKRVLPGVDVQMGHLTIRQPLPQDEVEQVSPFLLLHHLLLDDVEPGVDILGVGPHPHRGFEPVTFVFDGEVAHRDSRGNEGVVGPGGVQWMTAGMGIVHSERASKSFMEHGGKYQIIQLWVNLPQSNKMIQPRYQQATADQIPVRVMDEGRVRSRVIAGTFGDVQGPIETNTPVTARHFVVEAGGHTSVDVPAGHNAVAYVLEGEVQINEEVVPGQTLVAFEMEGDGFSLAAEAGASILVLSGTPIDEPVVQYGPFVMNSTTEILEAMRDYQVGKMGMLTY